MKSEQELGRMGRLQLLELIRQLEAEVEECHMLLKDALEKIEND